MSVMFMPSGNKDKKWKGFTFILPCVSVGNVGQLTVDLLISTLDLTLEGLLYDESILPMVGGDAIGGGDGNFKLTTACEIYASQKHKIVVLQQRVPLVKGKKKEFVSRLFEWVKASEFCSVVILTSMFAHARIDSQLHGSQLRHVCSASFEEQYGETLGSQQWMRLEPRPADTDALYLPGAGLAKSYYHKCCEEKIQCVIVLRFCAEGDNATDAVQLATHLNSLYQWHVVQAGRQQGWLIPASWTLQFGSRFEQTLYQ